MSCCGQPSVDFFQNNVFTTITLPDKPMALTILPNLHHALRLYQVLRLRASLGAGLVPPLMILKKLAASPKNRLNQALSEMWRIERSIFICDCVTGCLIPAYVADHMPSSTKAKAVMRLPAPFFFTNLVNSVTGRPRLWLTRHLASTLL
jgi:hypothetical protein